MIGWCPFISWLLLCKLSSAYLPCRNSCYLTWHIFVRPLIKQSRSKRRNKRMRAECLRYLLGGNGQRGIARSHLVRQHLEPRYFWQSLDERLENGEASQFWQH